MKAKDKVTKYVCAACKNDDLKIERCVLYITNGGDPTNCVFGGDEPNWEKCSHV